MRNSTLQKKNKLKHDIVNEFCISVYCTVVARRNIT